MWNLTHKHLKTKEKLMGTLLRRQEMWGYSMLDGHLRRKLTLWTTAMLNIQQEGNAVTAFLMSTLRRSTMTALQPPAGLPPHLQRDLCCPAPRLALHGRGLHTNALSVESASFTAMSSWNIRGCTLEKTRTSALSVGRPLGGPLTCQLTGGHSA